MRYVNDSNGQTGYEICQQILPNTIFFHNPPKREKFRAKSAGKLSCAGAFWNIFSDFFQHTWKSKCWFDIFPDFFLWLFQNLCAEFPPGTIQFHQRLTNIRVHDIQITSQCREKNTTKPCSLKTNYEAFFLLLKVFVHSLCARRR